MLKDNWTDKVDGVDINSADDINRIAHAVIDIENNDNTNDIIVDDELDSTSENPVQNKVVATRILTLETESGNLHANVSDIYGLIGDIDFALEELHNYAQTFIGGAE